MYSLLLVNPPLSWLIRCILKFFTVMTPKTCFLAREPGALLSILHVLAHLTHVTALKDMGNICSHFTDDKTEAQRRWDLPNVTQYMMELEFKPRMSGSRVRAPNR